MKYLVALLGLLGVVTVILVCIGQLALHGLDVESQTIDEQYGLDVVKQMPLRSVPSPVPTPPATPLLPIDSPTSTVPTPEQMETLPRWYIERTTDGTVLYEGPTPRQPVTVYDEMDRLTVEPQAQLPRLEALSQEWLDSMQIEYLSTEFRRDFYSLAVDQEIQIISSYDYGYVIDNAYYAVAKVSGDRPLTQEEIGLVEEALHLYAQRSRIYDLKCKVTPNLQHVVVEDLKSTAQLVRQEDELLNRLREQGIRMFKASGSLSGQTHERLMSR